MINYREYENLKADWKYNQACALLDEGNSEIEIGEGIDLLTSIKEFYTIGKVMDKIGEWAVRGNSEAISALETWHENSGRDDAYYPEDMSVTFGWRLILAQKGNSEAQEELGNMYKEGLGVEQNYDGAALWFAECAVKNPYAPQEFAEIYLQGLTTQISEEYACLPMYEAACNDYKPAMDWIRATAERGVAHAQFFMGTAYKNGVSDMVLKDGQMAMEWYEKAAEQGHPGAMHFAAMMYSDGKYLPTDYEKAVLYMQKAIDAGLKRVKPDLAHLYDQGHGVPQDHAKAIELLEESVAEGSHTAEMLLAEHYLNGIGVEQDLDTAKELYERSLPGDFKKSYLGLAQIYEEEEDYDAAAENYAVGLQQDKRINEINTDFPKYDLIGADGQMQAVWSEMTDEGWKEYGHMPGDDEGQGKHFTFEQLQEAAEAGDMIAQHDLAFCLFQGFGDCEKDVLQAMLWYEKAANGGHAQSAFNLGYLYYSDEGYLCDSQRACHWFRLAMNLLAAKRR